MGYIQTQLLIIETYCVLPWYGADRPCVGPTSVSAFANNEISVQNITLVVPVTRRATMRDRRDCASVHCQSRHGMIYQTSSQQRQPSHHSAAATKT